VVHKVLGRSNEGINDSLREATYFIIRDHFLIEIALEFPDVSAQEGGVTIYCNLG
jgi:hypothetical protein